MIDTSAAAGQLQVETPALGRVHKIVQFNDPPTSDILDALAARGIVVVGAVPVNGLLISMDADLMQAASAAQPNVAAAPSMSDFLSGLGARYAASVSPSDKISPMIAPSIEMFQLFGSQLPGLPGLGAVPFNGYFILEFHPDVNVADVRRLILDQGVELVENPDLSANHLLIHFVNLNQMVAATFALTADDRVAYLFPASEDLANGAPSRSYASAVTIAGPIGQIIATNGNGWDGTGQNATTLAYFFSALTAKIPAAQVKSEIQRAMAEWAKVIKLTWTPGYSSWATRTVNILFGSGAHGDAYPFDGPGGVLAHTFYPAPPNPEPIAGDMHLDGDEYWNVGVNTDLFSVSLHELGHALGLGHSDNPADVMYPYYKIVSTLAPGDKSAILTMYAAQESGTPSGGTGSTGSGSGGSTGTGTGAPVPLNLAVQTPAAPGTAASLALSGSISGGAGTVTITWSANGSSGSGQLAGTSWTISNIPLVTGVNSIVVNAKDSSRTVSRTLSVTRLAPSVPAGVKDTTAPTLTINSPASTSVTTSLATFSIAGTAVDNVAVASVTWATNTGSSGTASGTANWSAQIPLLKGFNQVIVRAADTSGNYSWRSIVVARR